MGPTEKLQLLADLSQSIIYIAGGSFVAGSAATLLVLLMLDFVRRNDGNNTDDENYPE